MNLEISIRQARGLKHTGKHCVELTLDGHSPQRTRWVDDEYDFNSMKIEPKDFQSVGKKIIMLNGSEDRYQDAWLHITLVHQRLLGEKRAAEAHIPFTRLAGLSEWIALEHKSKFAGKLYIVVNSSSRGGRPAAPAPASSMRLSQQPQALQQSAAPKSPRQQRQQHQQSLMGNAGVHSSGPASTPEPVHGLDIDEDLETQMAILASIQAAQEKSPRNRSPRSKSPRTAAAAGAIQASPESRRREERRREPSGQTQPAAPNAWPATDPWGWPPAAAPAPVSAPAPAARATSSPAPPSTPWPEWSGYPAQPTPQTQQPAAAAAPRLPPTAGAPAGASPAAAWPEPPWPSYASSSVMSTPGAAAPASPWPEWPPAAAAPVAAPQAPAAPAAASPARVPVQAPMYVVHAEADSPVSSPNSPPLAAPTSTASWPPAAGVGAGAGVNAGEYDGVVTQAQSGLLRRDTSGSSAAWAQLQGSPQSTPSPQAFWPEVSPQPHALRRDSSGSVPEASWPEVSPQPHALRRDSSGSVPEGAEANVTVAAPASPLAPPPDLLCMDDSPQAAALSAQELAAAAPAAAPAVGVGVSHAAAQPLDLLGTPTAVAEAAWPMQPAPAAPPTGAPVSPRNVGAAFHAAAGGAGTAGPALSAVEATGAGAGAACAGAVAAMGAAAEFRALPAWLEWPRYLVEHPDAGAPPPPAGSTAVAVGTRPASSVGAPAPEPTGRRRALLIGVSYRGTPAELIGSVSDVESVRAVLSRVGFAPEWTLCLTEEQADPSRQPTHRNIIAGLRWLAHGAAPGDALFFHFSGHGAQQEDPDAQDGEDEALDDAIVPVDVQQEGQITDNQIYALLVQPLPAGVRLTALVDCVVPCQCVDLPFLCDPRRGWLQDPNPHHVECDAICISATPEDEGDLTPQRLGELRQRPGLVTSAFLEALQVLAARRQGPATFLELLAQMYRQMEQTGHPRRPQLSASQAFDPTRRHFRFFDPVPNGNAELGLRAPRLHRSRR